MSQDTDESGDREDQNGTWNAKYARSRRGGRGRGGAGLAKARHLAALVKARREERGWTQQEVVQRGHLSMNRLQSIEAGRTGSYRRTTLQDLDRGLEWHEGSAERILYGKSEHPLPLEEADLTGSIRDLHSIDALEIAIGEGSGQPVSAPSDTEQAASDDLFADLIRNRNERERAIQLEADDLRMEIADLRRRLLMLAQLAFRKMRPNRRENVTELHHEVYELIGVVPIFQLRNELRKYDVSLDVLDGYRDPWEAAIDFSKKGQHDVARAILEFARKSYMYSKVRPF